jgi:hypothetical protein
VLLGVVRDTALGGEKNAGQLGSEFLFGVGRVTESVAFIKRLPIQPFRMAAP